MKISIIIPCYNAGKYLSACLDSILAQSERDFEVILVDDGSVDDTLAIAQKYAQMDARVQVYHQENAGVCAARNYALEHAQGEWIAFVDGDDLLPEDALAVMLCAASDDVDMVVCAHETFDEEGRTEIVWPQTRWMDLPQAKKRHAAALRLIEGDSVLNIMCNKLHRRALIEKEHIRLVRGIAIAEDALFNLEAVLCGKGIAYVNRVTYRYRIHSQSATQARAGSEFDVHAPWLKAMRAMLERRGEMEAFYAAYVDSTVLRLYKDGGIPGVMKTFAKKAAPLLLRGGMDKTKLQKKDACLLALCESGRYAQIYPLIAVYQIVCRKCAEAAFRLRMEKERPQ